MKPRRIVAVLVVVAVALIGAVAPASGHATLIKAEPRDGAMLADAPAQFELTFNEPVAPLVFRLFAPDGSTLAPSVEAHDRIVTLRPPRALAQGSYILSWRVISADGHPAGGALQFAVGMQSGTPLRLVAGEDRAVAIAIWAARLTIYLGLFIGIGGALFASRTGPPLPRATDIVIAAALGVALAAVPLSIGFQGADALELPLLSFWQPDVGGAGLRTSYGTSALIAGVAFILALASLFATGAPRRVLSLTALTAGACALAASGHASNASPQWIMRPSVFIHAAAVALWAGSLVPLFALAHGQKYRPALALFSRAIPFVLAALAVSGAILAIVQLAQVSALWTTAYGRVLIAKFALLAALAALAAFNRFALTPVLTKGHKHARKMFRRTVGAEIACMLAIFALVGLWRFTPPPRALAPGEPAFVHLHGEHMMADVTLTPGRVGPVEVRVRLYREDFQPLPAKQVTVMLFAEGMEPLARPATRSPDGDWRIGAVVLPISGIWTIQIETLIGDFDRRVLDGPLVIAR